MYRCRAADADPNEAIGDGVVSTPSLVSPMKVATVKQEQSRQPRVSMLRRFVRYNVSDSSRFSTCSGEICFSIGKKYFLTSVF